MSNATVKKVESDKAPRKGDHQKVLVSGKQMGMRYWENEEPGTDKPTVSRPYETVGYVLKGKAELHIDDQKVVLEEGDSYLVPKDAEHTYAILETFSAVEVTSPPAHVSD